MEQQSKRLAARVMASVALVTSPLIAFPASATPAQDFTAVQSGGAIMGP